MLNCWNSSARNLDTGISLIVFSTFLQFLQKVLNPDLLSSMTYPFSYTEKEQVNLPNQELSVLYGGPTLNYREQSSLYVPHMLRVIWQEIWHICNCLIYRVNLDLYAESLIYREKEYFYAEVNGYFP